MSISPPHKRRGAAAAGGILVIGSGLAVGVLAADMQHSWARDQVARQAAVTAAGAAQVPDPVIVFRTTVRHVTPDPVEVHEKVVRRLRGKATGSTIGRSSASTSSSPARASRPRRPRTVVAPAPRPKPARAKARAATTSKAS